MATFTKVNDFVKHLAEGVHNLASDTITVALSNNLPGSESSDPTTDGNGLLANVTQISYTYASSRDVTLTSSSQTSGTYKLVLQDLTISASGGTVGPFRSVYLFNSTTTGATNPLIGVFDYGSSITLQDGESITIDFDPTNGVLQLS